MDQVASKVNFDNTELAFQAQSDAKLKRTYTLYRLIDNPFLTKIGPPLLTSSFKIGLPIKGIVKNTLYDLFVGGPSLENTDQKTEYLSQYGVKTILDYSVEGEKTEFGFDTTQKEFISTIQTAHAREEIVFSALKMSGLARFGLMEKIQMEEKLSQQEENEWKRAIDRIEEIASLGYTLNVPFFIDAEESWVQEPIDHLTEDLMQKYNATQPIVWHTIQFYRWDRLAYLEKLIQDSKEKGYILAVKLVRGAYLEKERKRAQEMGYKDPIQPNKKACDDDYNRGLELCIKNHSHVAVCAGTHNEYSSKYLADLMAQHGIEPNDPKIWFAQLLGMSDHISFNLSHGGYNAAKYLPYGPVKAVMPYLMRRAQENTAIAGQSSREVELLKKEMKRRKLI
ncbi:MAG: proline dehydrogenase family protein [Bacteroidia bacterium]|nr:proline dehydrogenase family protein [Bacteroidia bacterium]